MGTKWQGTQRETRALDAFIALSRAAESVAFETSRHLASAGLTQGQFGVLEAIYHLGPLCQKDLGEKILRTGGNMTVVVTNLERRRLVRRQRGGADRRFVTVSLTATGRALIQTVLPKHVRGVLKVMEALSPEEQETLRALCRTLGLAAAVPAKTRRKPAQPR